MTTAENLNRIIEAKSDIKQAIEEKGVTVGDITIDGYANKVREIAQSGTGGKWVVPYGVSIEFSHMTSTSLDVTQLDTSNLTDMSSMFHNCSKLTEIKGIGNWNTSEVTDMNHMFFSCDNLTSLEDLSNWDTSEVTNMYAMFNYCPKLTEIKGIWDWDTSRVTNMCAMFEYCSNLVSLDLSSWDTSRVTDMSEMFKDCTSLTEVKMGGDVSKVTTVNNMFGYIKTTGTFYYNPQYDYSKIIAVLPSTWTAVPME